MTAEPALIGIALLVVVAAACGLLAAGLRQPPVVGYILAGVLVGPAVLGVVEDREPIRFVAERGVLALLFVAGMRLRFAAFRSVYRTALLATGLQIAASVALLLVVAPLFDWPPALAVFLGFVISLSSTAVGLRMLEDAGELDSPTGRTVIAILIAQDLAVVPILIAVNALVAADAVSPGLLARLALAAGLIAAAVVWFGRRPELPLPFRRFIARHRDLAAVFALTSCFGAGAISGTLGLSTAFGAFLAGLYLGNTGERERLTGAVEPIEGVLVMVFFLSIGLLLDPAFIWANLGKVLFLLLAVLGTSSLINVLALRLVGETWRGALVTGFALAQIGEFSFVLSEIGAASGLIDRRDHDLVVAVIAISLAVSPLWLGLARALGALRRS